MAHIKSRKHSCAAQPHRVGCSAAVAAALALALPVHAQQATPPAAAPAKPADQALPEVKVKGATESDYKVDKPASPKYTAPLLDTPQTITVIPARVLEEQSRTSLVEALSTIPGITFGAGEGGGGYGDSINFRGYSANNNITSDGMRDSAQYNRSDAFNIEQIEVSNGANSVYGGAGNVSGGINLVSKSPKRENFVRLGVGLGTDQYRRATADVNRVFGETTAVRVNLMAHHNDVPGRDVEKFERWGFAPSVAFGLNTPTKFTLSYFHQHDKNVPQYGVPYYKGPANDGPLPGVDSSNYYGYRNFDRQKIDVDTLTAVFDHRFSDSMSLRNQTRAQRVEQDTIVDPPQGTWCLANNVTPGGTPCVATSNVGTPPVPVSITVPPGFYMPTGPRGNWRVTTNTMLANQTDLTFDFKTGSVAHTLVTGLAFTHEKFDLDNYRAFRNEDGSDPFIAPDHFPFMDIYNPDNVYDGPDHKTLTAKTRGEQTNAAIYAFDNLKFNEQWSLNGGLRYEYNKGTSHSTTAIAPDTGVETWGTRGENKDNLFSYRLGLVYKPVPNASVYVAFGNSQTPSKASVNGSCTANGPGVLNSNCSVDPEKARTIEIGTKWDVMDNRLSLTAAIFRNELTNYRVATNDPEQPIQQLDGKSRADGIALGAAGEVMPGLNVFANYTYLKTKVLQGASKYCRSGNVAPDQEAACAAQRETTGDPLTGVPEHAFSLWTTYQVVPRVTVGYGATYQGDWYITQGVDPLYKADGYWVHNAMVAWNVSREWALQLNVKNLGDKTYYTRVRNNGWATPGDGRAAVLSASYSF